MKYINQKHSMDCLQATYANLLGLPYEDIPEFYKFFEDEDQNKWVDMVNTFFSDLGYFRILFDVKYDEKEGFDCR